MTLASCATRLDRNPRGPLPSRVEHPLSIGLLSMRPRRAVVQAPGAVGASVESSYVSIHEVQHDDEFRVAFDGELWHNALRLRAGVGASMDLEMELGVLSGRAGFLDSFAEDWHDFTGFPDGGRSQDPRDLYRMRIRRGDEVVYELEKGEPGLTDLPLILTKQLAEGGAGESALALRVGVELPTGDEDKGFGNGALDYGLGLIGERHWTHVSLYGGLDYVVTGRPASFEEARVDLEDQVHVQVGVELPMTERSACLTQLEWVSRMISDIDLEEVDREIFDLGVGYAYDLTESATARVAFHEDLVAATGPDFSFFLSLSWGF